MRQISPPFQPLWYESGMKKDELNYRKGILEKKISWFENGIKSMEGKIKGDKKYGRWVYYNEDSSIKEEIKH